jgi:hypothetical protein
VVPIQNGTICNAASVTERVGRARLGLEINGLKVLLLRAETLVGHSFENTLRSAGHPVTVISSREAAFSLIESMRPDLIVFDPISEFGFSGSVQRLRSSFDGPIVATGLDQDSPMTSSLELMGITMFAPNAAELLAIARDITPRVVKTRKLETLLGQPARPQITSPRAPAQVAAGVDSPGAEIREASPPRKNKRSERLHWVVAGMASAIVVLVVVLLVVFLPRPTDEEPVAKALPVVPRILLKPLVPLTIEELSGDTLPLEISGIKDRTEIEAPAVAFWGDTAPDAFVTVNGEKVQVSEYGAFVVDFPLEDGANFIEVIASDFEGRTSRVSFTVVRTQ